MYFLYTFVAILAIAVLVSFAWRALSHRYALPCPAWLGWILDSPYGARSKKSLLARLDIGLGMKVLDAGCGPGRLAIPIAEIVGPEGRVTGVDLQGEMLRRARERAERAGLANTEYLQCGLGEGRLQKDAYDRAVLVMVLGEIRDRSAALRETFTALKPGGQLCVAECLPDPHFQTRATVRRLAALAGFEERACHGGAFAFTMVLAKPSAV